MNQRKIISKGVLCFGAALTAGALGYTLAADAPSPYLVVSIAGTLFLLLLALVEEDV